MPAPKQGARHAVVGGSILGDAADLLAVRFRESPGEMPMDGEFLDRGFILRVLGHERALDRSSLNGAMFFKGGFLWVVSGLADGLF